MWKLKGFGPPTPREIHHFYTLRQAGNRGTYFLISSAVENWIPEGAANPRQVEVSSDEKKKGFIWGFPTSNKRWKNSWFFVVGEWGRDVPASGRRNLSAKKVPRYFTSPEAWSKAIPVLLDGEISHLVAAAVLSLDESGRPFLLDEEKMITQWIFPRLPARLPRRKFYLLSFNVITLFVLLVTLWLLFAVCDFDTVCDMQARAVKNSEAASKRHAAGLAKEGIASPDGGDPSDGEEVGDVTRGDVESGQPPVHPEVAASTPAATTPSRKGKEKVGISGVVNDIPIFDADVPETPLDPPSDLALRTGRGKRPAEATHEGPVEGTNAAVPPPEEVNELNVPAPTPTPTPTPTPPRAVCSPRVASPSAAVGEPNISSTGQPRPPGRPESAGQPGPSKQPGAFASTFASGSGVAREAPHVGSTEADEGTMSLSDFSAAEICSHLINHNVYISEGWEHVKSKPCNRKMEFFFNCHSLMMSELAESYRHRSKVSRESKRLRDQEFVAARLEAEQLAEEAKEKAECEALDLRNQLSSYDVIFNDLKAVLEVEAVDCFKRSPVYDALLLCEFERGMRQSKKFFAMKDHSNEKALRRFDKSLQRHMASAVGSIKEQRQRWKAHCCYTRTEPHPMHLEIPSKHAFNTYYSGQKGSFSGSSAEPDLGPVAGRDYGPFMPGGDEKVVWPSEDEIEDDEDSEDPPTAS
ncbi:hypothetical protein Q3G72_015021 [Acer saccharum]|nr:hypothetical protein Q3G72_015021 [Acer saccharum]